MHILDFELKSKTNVEQRKQKTEFSTLQCESQLVSIIVG